ncbi:MAG: flippase activity-associated protein Agl23 [Coraliomargarita sp.]
MSQRYLIGIGWLAILALALWLRVHKLGERPMHADEATGARILSNLLEDNNYSFDPKHYHGPFLSYSSSILSTVTGETNWNELSKKGLRIGPALAGILLTLTPLIWVRHIGHPATLAAAALLASSPLLVYYNRMYIHESWLALFAMLACGLGYRLLNRPQGSTAILTGVSIGLMFATKETFVISVLSWGVATVTFSLALLKYQQDHSVHLRRVSYIKPVTLLTLSFIFTATLFYSNGFRSVNGVIDAVRTYFVYETSAGHNKSAVYYLELMLQPKNRLGLWWTEISVALLCLIAFVAAFVHSSRRSTVLFLASTVAAHVAIYSLISYKTPWLMLVPWAHACLLAGLAIQQLGLFSRTIRATIILVLLVTLMHQTQQSILASGNFANDSRNPYAYVATSKDAEALENWLTQLQELETADQFNPVAVVGNGYWPLPWYLRKFDTVGYWSAPTDTMTTYPIIITMPEHEETATELLSASHIALPRGLRSNFSITVFLRNDIWHKWSETPSR